MGKAEIPPSGANTTPQRTFSLPPFGLWVSAYRRERDPHPSPFCARRPYPCICSPQTGPQSVCASRFAKGSGTGSSALNPRRCPLSVPGGESPTGKLPCATARLSKPSPPPEQFSLGGQNLRSGWPVAAKIFSPRKVQPSLQTDMQHLKTSEDRVRVGWVQSGVCTRLDQAKTHLSVVSGLGSTRTGGRAPRIPPLLRNRPRIFATHKRGEHQVPARYLLLPGCTNSGGAILLRG